MQVVITGVRSRTHVVHLAAYLRDRRDVTSVTYLSGGSFLGVAHVSTEDVRRLLGLPDSVPFEEVRSVSALAALEPDPITYLSVGAPGIKPWLVMRRAAPRRRIRVVVTDEGLGTYGDWSTRRAAWRRQGGSEPWTSVRAMAVEAAVRRLTTTRQAMYDATRAFELDARIAAEFARHVGAVRPAPDDPRIVFLSSPWVELGLLDPSAQRDHVRAVADRAAQLGKRLVVRPHPAEDPSKYEEFDVIDTPLPAELDPSVVGASEATGGTSTALLNLSALYGMPATRVTAPGLERLERSLSCAQRALLARYLPPAVTLGS